MLTAIALVLWKLAVALLVVIAVVDLLNMFQKRHIRHCRQQGLSQASIADSMAISRYAVRKALIQ